MSPVIFQKIIYKMKYRAITRQQITIHLFIIYFKEKQIEHVSYVIIFDLPEHNTVAVYTFQKKLITILKIKFLKLLK